MSIGMNFSSLYSSHLWALLIYTGSFDTGFLKINERIGKVRLG